MPGLATMVLARLSVTVIGPALVGAEHLVVYKMNPLS